MAKKISEFTEGTDMKETDIIPYVDLENQTTKKITLENLFKSINKFLYKYDFQHTFVISPQGIDEIELPAYYKKGAGVLQVYFEGCLLTKDIHYEERKKDSESIEGDILNTILVTSWDVAGTYNMSIIIQGFYEAPTESEVDVNE